MEQLSLFDTIGETSMVSKENNAENEQVDSEDGEVELKTFTSEQQEILSFAEDIIKETLDPWCPLQVYISAKNYFKIDYFKGENKTVFMQFASEDAVKKAIENRKMFENATIQNVEKIDFVPENEKVVGSKADLFSFMVDLSLSKPKWFSIENKTKFYRVQVVFNPNDKKISDEVKQNIQQYKNNQLGVLLSIDTETKDHNDLMKLLSDIRQILKNRFEFLYDHRLVEQCGCELQSGTTSISYYRDVMHKDILPDTKIVNDSFVKITDYCCIDQKRCLSKSREMQMKCGFRRLMERNGKFVTSPKYKGY